MLAQRRLEIRPALLPRIGASGRIDHPAKVGVWDYAAELYPPGAFHVEPPKGLAWAHRVDHRPPSATAEIVLDVVIDLWAAWVYRSSERRPWDKGRRPFLIKPEDWW